MAGFWASRGVFQFRSDDARVGGFLAARDGYRRRGRRVPPSSSRRSASPTWRPTDPGRAPRQPDAVRAHGLGFRGGRRGRRLAGRADRLRPSRPTTRGSGPYLHGRHGDRRVRARLRASFRLLFGPTGYFSTVDGVDLDATGRSDRFLGGANLTSWRVGDPAGLIGAARRRRCSSGSGALRVGPARRQRPPLPGLGRRADDRPGGGDDLGTDRGRRLRRRDRWRHGRARGALPDASA